ncbi:UNVERIFIED_CONTAM: hypothetical protein FKN15_050843 [Acipenser sinensis]
MFQGLAQRPWHALCRFYLQHHATRVCQPCHGWKDSRTTRSLWYSLPASYIPGTATTTQIHFYSSTSGEKDGPDKTSTTASPDKASASQPKPEATTVRAVLKKRDYGSKYTKNNFITVVRAMNEFCLKPSDLEQLRKIRRRSPHDDTEAFTVFLRSDVEAKALEVWGSHEALGRECKLRKEVEQEYKENLFQNQKLLKEYKDFLGNTKPRSGKSLTFSQGPGKVVMVAICIALEVWGSHEALGRECKLRKEVEQENKENLFQNQKLLKEYKDFLGNTKPRSGKSLTFSQGPGKVVMVAICINGLNFFFKLLAWVYTGSASMFSEAIHSLADTCNQPRSGKSLTFSQGPGKVVMVAICINGLNFFFKLLAWVYTGSASMFSEAIHSLADTCNQEIQQVKTPEELENFMLKHGENIIDTLGAEVDRLEKELKVTMEAKRQGEF